MAIFTLTSAAGVRQFYWEILLSAARREVLLKSRALHAVLGTACKARDFGDNAGATSTSLSFLYGSYRVSQEDFSEKDNKGLFFPYSRAAIKEREPGQADRKDLYTMFAVGNGAKIFESTDNLHMPVKNRFVGGVFFVTTFFSACSFETSQPSETLTVKQQRGTAGVGSYAVVKCDLPGNSLVDLAGHEFRTPVLLTVKSDKQTILSFSLKASIPAHINLEDSKRTFVGERLVEFSDVRFVSGSFEDTRTGHGVKYALAENQKVAVEKKWTEKDFQPEISQNQRIQRGRLPEYINGIGWSLK